jgi:hypothetical protein
VTRRIVKISVRIKPGSPKKAVAMITAQEGDLISYAGDQLNQYDADVFLKPCTERGITGWKPSASSPDTASLRP